MRCLVSYALVASLLFGTGIYASEEISFDQDPVVTVNLERETAKTGYSFVYVSLFSVGAALLALTAYGIYNRR